jgi:recombination protein RecR
VKIDKKFKEISFFLETLEGIGEKKSKYLALQFLGMDKNKLDFFLNLLSDIKDNVKLCKICNSYSYIDDVCEICSNQYREKEVLIVEKVDDLLFIEKIGFYRGFYFVLHNLISPIKGITPENLGMEKLIKMLKEKNIVKIIFALPKSTEGNITTSFLKTYIKKRIENIEFYEFAEGLSDGFKISEFNESTLKEAFNNMKKI